MRDRELIPAKVEAFIKELEAAEQKGAFCTKPCDERRFILLLGGVSGCRRVPGIDSAMGFEELYRCESEEKAAQVREHLHRVYGVTDKTSLLEACEGLYCSDYQYRQFLSFWDGEPVFDEDQLDDQGRKAFRESMGYAQLLRPYVERQGFFAWDCNERIGLLRAAAACGLISDEVFWEEARLQARRASALYGSWREYAVSCLCGAVYFMYGQNGRQEKGLEDFCDLILQLLRHLFFELGAWAKDGWYFFDGKRYAIQAGDIRELLRDWEGPAGCIATDRVTVEGRGVGYLYREEPSPGMPDSGWRFFAGDESDAYTDDAANSQVYHLNTICNYSPDILPLLNAPAGTAYFRDENGVFQKEELPNRREGR